MAFAALTIDINAKLANLEAGLGRAESQLAGFAKKAESAAAGIAAGFGAIAGGLAVSAVLDRFAAAVTELSALDDAAESTGASVEELSSILNTVAPTGIGLEQITEYATKLAKAMREAEDPTSAVAQAFKALGVATKEADGSFRSTGQVVEDVARALSGYADGTNKTALAQVLLGKSGAEALPFLKDLATRTKESATVSAEAAAEAERLANAWRAIKRDGELVVQSIAAQIIPALADLAERFRETGKAGGTMWDQIRGVLGPNKAIADLEKDLAGLTEQRSVAERLGFSKEALDDFDARIARVRKSIDALRPAQRQVNGPTPRELLFGNAGYGDTDKPPAPKVKEAPPPKAAAAQRQSEAERLLQTLTGQLEVTQQLTLEQQILAKIGRGEIDGLTPTLEQQILLRAVQIDRIKEQERVSKEAAQSEEADIRAINDLTRRAREEREQQIEIWENLADPARKYRLELERISQIEAAGGFEDADQAARARKAVTIQMLSTIQAEKSETEKVQDAARDLGLTFESAFEKAIVGGSKLSDVLQGLAQDVARIFLRKTVTEPIAGALTGGIQSLFGGGATAATSAATNGAWDILPAAVPLAVKGGGGSAGSITYVYNIDSRTDRSVIVADIQRAQAGTIAKQYDMQARGMAGAA